MDVGELSVKITADLAGLRSEVEKAVRTMEQLKGGAQRAESSVKSSFASIGTSAKALGATLGVAFTVREVIQFGQRVIDLGGRLTDLSQRTGLTTTLLSGMKSTLEENGTTLEAFATSISIAQKNLGEINKTTDPAAQAIRHLGLNLDELRNVDTDEFLRQVTDALSKIENPMERAAVGSAILGRQFREIAPAIMEMAGRLNELRRSGLSAEDIATLDEAGDALTRLGNNALWAGAKIMNFVRNDIAKFKVEMQDFVNWSKRVITREAFQGGPVSDKNLATFLEDLEKVNKGTGWVGPAVRGMPEKPPPFKGFGDTGGVDKAKQAVDAFVNGLVRQRQAMEVAVASMDSGEAAARRMAIGFELANFQLEFFNATGQKLTAQQTGKIKALADEYLRWAEAVDVLKMQQDAAKRAIQEFDQETEKQENTIRAAVSSMNDWAIRMRAMDDLVAAGVTDFEELTNAADGIASTETAYQRQIDILRAWQDELEELGDQYSALIDQIQQRVDRLSLEKAQARTRGLLAASPFMEDIDLAAQKENTQITEQAASQQADLRNEFQLTYAMQQMLGGGYDGLSSRIAIQQRLVQSLIESHRAITPEVEREAEALRKLQQIAQNQQVVMSLVDSISTALDQSIQGVIQGTQTYEDAMRNLARNILLAFSNELTKLAIINPLKNIIADMMGATTERLPTLSNFFASLFGGGEKATGGVVGGAASAVTGGLGSAVAGAALETAGISLNTAGISLNTAGATLNAAAAALATSAGVSAGGSAVGAGGGGFFSGIWKWLTSFFGGGGTSMHTGGYVPQFARGGDVPALLDPGEFVMQKSAVNELGVGKLAAMNAGDTTRISEGPRMINLTVVQDYTGAMAPSDAKAGKREVKQHIIELTKNDRSVRTSMREAVRK